jgi:predicted lipoprotein with Yx(FWY)xxD motif
MTMATKRARPRAPQDWSRVDRATFQPGDYGRVARADGTEQWWVRSGHGTWIALAHQRVIENEDGTITLLYVK